MFSLSNTNISNANHAKFVDDCQKSMSEAFKIVNEQTKKSGESNKMLYDKNVFGQTNETGDRVLLRNLSERGGTGKLRSWWEDNIYIVQNCDKNIPIFKIKSEGNLFKTKTVHRNLLLKVNEFSLVKSLNSNIPRDIKPRVIVEHYDEEDEYAIVLTRRQSDCVIP